MGGTSVWKEVVALLPHENTVYLADSRNAPYGVRSKQEIIDLSIKNTQLLLDMDCKMIVVPCNTATTNAISYLRETYKVPFVGIEPAIKPAALGSKSKRIGVLATMGTLSSELFHKTQLEFASEVETIEVVGTGIVELIEAGKHDSREMRELLISIIEPFMIAGIDYLVLGCSHYPYVKELLEELLPTRVQIIDSGRAVARQVKQVLTDFKLINHAEIIGNHRLYSNTTTSVLEKLNSKVVENIRIATMDF